MSEEFKQNQKRLKASEEKYKLILENSNDLITIINESFECEYINEKAHIKMMGYALEDLLGKKAFNLLHPDDLELTLKALKDRGKSIEVRIKNKKGNYIWMETTAEYYKNPEGKDYVLTIARDISKRKEAALKLIESEKKYKALANSLPEVIFEIDTYVSNFVDYKTC